VNFGCRLSLTPQATAPPTRSAILSEDQCRASAIRCLWARPARADLTGQIIGRRKRPHHSAPQQDARGSAIRPSFKALPDNAVEYFVSYYDINQPESLSVATAPTPSSRKKAQINEQIARMRPAPHRALLLAVTM